MSSIKPSVTPPRMFLQSKRLLSFGVGAAFLLSQFPPLPAFALPSTDSLVGYWKFDETSGSVAVDSSGDGKTGTHNNTPTISTTVPTTNFSNARSLQFAGAGTKRYVSSSLAWPSTAGTMSAWVYPTSYSDWSVATGWKLTGANNGYILLDEGGSGSPGRWRAVFRPDLSGNAEVNIAASSTITQNAWSHISMTWSKSGGTYTFALYVNGVLQGTNTWTGSVGSSGVGNFAVARGGDTDDNYYTGNVDDVRVYKRALTQSEMTDLAAGYHPQSFWKGMENQSYESPGNWSGSFLPDPYRRITIRANAYPAMMTGAIQAAGLTINTGALLHTGGTGITLRDSGTFTNYGTLAMKGAETLTSFTNDSNKGTILVFGTGTYTGLPTGTSYYNLNLNDGLVGYWQLDEISGTRAADSSGYGNSGALLGGASMSTTVAPVHFSNPRSISFDGVNDYVMLPDSTLLQPNNLTVGAWFKTTSASHQIILRKRWNGFSLRINNGQVISSLWESSGSSYDLTSPLTYNDDKWHHALFTYDGTTVLLYVDGTQVARQTGAGTRQIYYEPGGISIGRDGDDDSGYFVGNIDDVRMYKRVLRAGEIHALAVGNQPSTGLATTTLSGLMTLNGSLILNGGTLDVSSSSYGLIIGKSWFNNGGKFVPRSSSVSFTGTTSGLEILSGGQSFAKLTFNGSGGTWSAHDRLTASGTSVLLAGTLDASTDAFTMSFGQFVQNGGTILPRGGTILLTSHSNLTHTFTSELGTLRLEDPMENGLVAYWKFDEGTNSGSIIDVSGSRNTGVRRGSGTIWSGTTLPSLDFVNVSGMKFNGQGDRVTATVNAGIPSNPTNLTQAMWVKTTMSTGNLRTLVTRRNQSQSSFSDWPTLFMSGGLVTFAVDDNSYMNTTSYIAIGDGQWHHVAGVKSGTTYSLYIDGVLRSSIVDSHSMGGASGLAYNIGFAPNWNSSYFEGYMDDVRVYSRALSSGEVENLARGYYAAGESNTATFTLGNDLSVNKLYVDSGKFSTDTHDLTSFYPLIITRGNGTVTLGSGLATLGGLVMSGSTMTGGSGDLDINWDVQIFTGSFIAPSGRITIDGNWQKWGGTFNANGGTVILDGTNQTINGANTFHHLSKLVASADTLYFGEGTTTAVDGVLTLQGAAGNLLSLRSNVSGDEWFIDPSGTRTLSYLDVKDSNNINATAIDCLNLHCVNRGNNTNWLLPDVVIDSAPEQTSGTTPQRVSTGGGRGHGTTMKKAIDVRTALINDFRLQIALSKTIPETRVRRGGSSSASSQSDTKIVVMGRSSARTRSSAGSTLPTVRIAEQDGKLLVAMADRDVLYSDVPVDEWYAPYVSQVITDGFAQGYKNSDGVLTGEFGVANNITRAEMLKMALEAAEKKPGIETAQLRNQSAKNTWASPYVGLAEKMQLTVFSATADVNVPATRGEVVQTILQAMGITIGNNTADYTDVPKTHKYSSAIAAATFFGVVQGDANSDGTPAGTFRPEDPINRAEVAKMIALAAKLLK